MNDKNSSKTIIRKINKCSIYETIKNNELKIIVYANRG